MAAVKKRIQLLIFVLITFSAVPQNLDFTRMGVKDGLPASEVYSVYQDRLGYIWAFTEYGIVKHNGTRFLPVCTNIPFSESVIYKVSETKNGELLIANSNARFYTVRNDQAIPVPGLEQLSAEISRQDQTVLDLVDDGAGNLYISTYIASYRFSLKHRTTTRLWPAGHPNEINFKCIGNRFFTQRSIVEGRSDLLFRITGGDGREIFSLPSTRNREGRNTICRSGKNYYLLNCQEVILVRPDGSVKKLVFDNLTLNIRTAPDGNIWVATAYGGLYELSPELAIASHYFEGAAISDILFDDQSGVWISTIGNGIYYCSDIHRLSWNDMPGLVDCISMLKAENGRLFVGTSRGNLYTVEQGRLEHKVLGNGAVYITDIIALENTYYIGAKECILLADMGFTTVDRAPVRHGAYAFAEATDHTLMIVSGSLLFEKLLNSEEYKVLSGAPRPRHVVCRFGSEFFISSGKGIFVWKNGLLLHSPYLRELQGKNISMLRMDDRKNLWICTKGDGLYRISPANKVTHFNHLPSRVISGICFAPNGVVLLSTNKGVYANEPDNLATPGSWKLVEESACTGMEVYDGRLFIATRQGLSAFDMNNFPDVPSYRFYFSAFSVNGKAMSSENIRLTHEQNNLFFQFDLLNYKFPTRQLVYHLKGPSSGNGSVNGTEIHLQNLEPGYYELTVIPLINSVACAEKAVVVPFYISPAFYETNLFMGILVFLSIVFIVLVTSFMFMRVLKKNERRRATAKLLAKYRLTALKAQVNPHFISNTLSAIQLLMLSGKTDSAGKYIARFSMLIRYLLNHSDKAVTSLESELTIIDLTIELEQLRFTDRFLFRKVIDPAIDLSKLFIPPLITQPFIENAIWHGLLPLKGKRSPLLELTIEQQNGGIVIVIADNGVGRSANSGKKRPLNPGNKESKGTVLMQNRMETLNVLHATSGAGIYIKDLKDEEDGAAGTEIRIVFPAAMLNRLRDEQDKEYYY